MLKLAFTFCLGAALGNAFPVDGKVMLSDRCVEACEKFWTSHDRELVGECEKLQSADWLDKRPHDLKRAIVSVSFVARGREFLEKFVPLWTEDKLAVESASSRRAKELGVSIENTGAFSEGTLFLHEASPLLALAATIVHEGTHALQKPGMDRIQSEHQAYRAQDRFLEEMAALEPEFKSLTQEIIDHRYLIAFPINEKVFRALLTHPRGYAIERGRVDVYFQNHRFDQYR